MSLFPVGTMQATGVSTPIVAQGRVVGFYDPYKPAKRKFPVDMAGFAVNLEVVLGNRGLQMPYQEGMQETVFLERVGVPVHDMEPLCKNATIVSVLFNSETQ